MFCCVFCSLFSTFYYFKNVLGKMIPELLITPACTRRGETLHNRADMELTRKNQGSLGVQSFYLFLSLE